VKGYSIVIDMTSEDINRTYAETYLGFMDEDASKVHPLFVLGATERNNFNAIIYFDDEREERSFSINDPQIVLTYPDSGAVTVSDNDAVFVSRQAQRQWRRGITSRHLVITGNKKFDPALVRAMYNPTYIGYAALIAGIESGSINGGALDRNFWIRKNVKYVNPVVMFRTQVIGEYKDGGILIKDKEIGALFEEAANVNP